MSIIRRTGARLLKLFRNEAGDPATDPARVQVYSKDDGGTGHLFARDTAGGIHQLTPPSGGGGGSEIFSQTPPANGPPPTMQFQVLAATPDSSRVYVNGQSQQEVWRFSTATNKWITTAPASIALNQSFQLLHHPSGTKMYALINGDRQNVYIIDTATNLVTGTMSGGPLPGFGYNYMAIQPGTNELWVHYDTGPNFVARFDTTTDAYIASFSAPTGNAYAMTFTPDGSKMYYLGADTLVFAPRFHIFDATTYTLITSISDTPLYRGLVMLPDGSEIWVTIDGSFPTNSSIVRYDTTTDTPVGSPILTSQDAGAPQHLAIKSDGSKVYALLFSGDIDVIDVASHAVTNTIAMSGEFAGDLIIRPDDAFLYASKTQGTKPYWVKVIDVPTETVVATITSADVTVPAPTSQGTFDGLRFVGVSVTDDGGGVAAITPPVVFDAGSTPLQNIKANRSGANASISDQTKAGQTNFGSGSTTAADHATVGGGLENEARGIASAVPGGRGNIARGDYSFAMGDGNEAEGVNSAAFGGSLTGPDAEGSFATNSSNVQGIWSTTVNYGGVGANSEACFTANDGFVDENSYGCSVLGVAFIDQNCNYCHAEGSVYIDVGADSCHGEGDNGYIGPGITAAHVEGDGCGVEADAGHAEGDGTQALGVGSHAEGAGTTAQGQNSHAEGTFSEALGYYSHAEGGATTAEGEGSHSEGDGCYAEGAWSHAQGSSSRALRETQFTHGGGHSGGFGGGGNGAAQTSWLQLRRHAVAGPGNSQPLIFGPSNIDSIVLQDDRAYDFVLTAIVNGTAAGPTYKTRTFRQRFNARCVAGVATIVASGTPEEYGDAATWTITPSAVTNTIVLTFATGADTHNCYVSANLEFIETRFS
jgi:hypothetical protein